MPISVMAALIFSGYRLQRIEVHGTSMIPSFNDRERLIVMKTKRLRLGDVVVFHDPLDSERILVKRLTAIGRSTITVTGDNRNASRDSRSFGEVTLNRVIGVVVYRYQPAECAGRIARPSRSPGRQD